MLSGLGKSSAFLLLSAWLAICLPTVAAQNKTPEQISRAGFTSETTDTATGKLRFDETTVVADALELVAERREKNLFRNQANAASVEEKTAHPTANRRTDIVSFNRHFNLNGERDRQYGFHRPAIAEPNEFSSRPPPARSFDDLKNAAADDDTAHKKPAGFRWGAAIRQSLLFLAVQHGYALTQPKTREALKGKFLKDYAESVKSLRGWSDGGRFFTNYIAHPMQGSMTGFIYVQNDPKATRQQFGAAGDYWRSRLKAMLWTAAWSTQFEIGPVSQASIGNVGLKGKQTWEDIVTTPTLGTAMLIAEDAVDRFIMQRIERRTDSFYVKIFSRMLLSPTRVFANLLRFKAPWYRDRPVAR